MGTVVGILVILFIIGVFASSESSTSSYGGATVNIGNTITYPDDMKCECGNTEFNWMRDIDTSTWDMNCFKCKKVAYKHPKREERKEQLDWLLDKCTDDIDGR